uniref:Autotransporter outer membrane beta-barrel domain-containing protein n=1 Tax=Ascaris lumbricoides TaxID=6252 RepID=A0A0M3IAM0_ASCLU
GANNQANAGASGSLSSSSSVVANQTLTWQSILSQLLGSAISSGIGNAQSNVILNGGNAENGVSANGVVSGTNNGANGNINSQVNAEATMSNNLHNVSNIMSGSASGSNHTSIVSANNIQSNASGVNNEGEWISAVTSFGDAKIDATVDGSANVNSNSEINTVTGASGQNTVNGTAFGTSTSMNISNGLEVSDGSGNTMEFTSSSVIACLAVATSNGQVQGSGTENSNTSLLTNSAYDGNGQTSVEVNGKGNAAGSNQTSALTINTNGQLSNSNGLNNTATGGVSGVADGEMNSLTGSSNLTMNGSGTIGQSIMSAEGGGKGPSSALTSAKLNITGTNDISKDITVQGSVSASGDKTYVHSVSSIVEKNGVQTITNFQNSSSQSQGSSSASASNVGILKRKKRHSVGFVFGK